MLNHKIFMNIANEIAKWSKCVSRQVGALIVKNNRVISTGYNGTPSGYPNCNDYWNGEYTPDHHDWSAKYEIHAEMNALIWAARSNLNVEWSDLYTTMQPCFQCTKNIIGAGIKNIYFNIPYKHHSWDELKDFIQNSGINIENIT